MKVPILNHWTAREFLKSCVLKIKKNVLFPVLFLVIREYTPSDLNFFFWFSQFVFCFKLKYSWFARCVSFKCIAQRFSYTHVYIFSSDSLTLEVITKYWVQFPVLYNRNRSLLVIQFIYSSVYILIPPSLAPEAPSCCTFFSPPLRSSSIYYICDVQVSGCGEWSEFTQLFPGRAE